MERVRRRAGRLKAAMVISVALLAGCGVEGEVTRDVRASASVSAQPSPPPRGAPPAAELRATDGRALGERGSFCWNFTRGGMCSDTDFLDPSFEVPVRSEEKLLIGYDREDDPVSLQVQAYTNPDARAPSDFLVAPKENPAIIRTDFPPGTHWLVVHSAWPEGDVAHYFKISVA